MADNDSTIEGQGQGQQGGAGAIIQMVMSGLRDIVSQQNQRNSANMQLLMQAQQAHNQQLLTTIVGAIQAGRATPITPPPANMKPPVLSMKLHEMPN